ncbi:MAG: RDD family protein [Elusimicrobia bacterium]|nr:RDD family protein [Elusimicrobiota bacterium]
MSELNINLNEENESLKSAEEQTKSQEIVNAGFSERFLAYVIDTLPFWFLVYFTYDFLVKNGPLSSFSMTAWKILWIALFFLYEIIFSSGGRATLGKYLLGIRVRASDGGELSPFKAFLRTIGYFIGSYTINLGYMIALFTPGKKALHDYLAGSRVIKIKERGDFAEGTVLVLSWALMAFFAGNWVQKSVLAVTPYEQRQISKANRTIAKLAKLQEIHFQKYGFYTDDIKRLADLTRNIPAVRKEISDNLAENSLEIASNGKHYIISAKAKNWRKTKVEASDMSENKSEQNP